MDDRRGALIGAVVTGVAGAVWTVWGASELPAAGAIAVMVVGVAVALVIVATAVRDIPRTRPSERDAMFRTRTYRITTAAEVVAVVAGVIVLGRLGLGEFIVVWVAAIVGLHFLVFGRAFRGAYYVVGAGLLVAALLGLVLGLIGDSEVAVVATTALLSAVVLLGSGVAALRRAGAVSA